MFKWGTSAYIEFEGSIWQKELVHFIHAYIALCNAYNVDASMTMLRSTAVQTMQYYCQIAADDKRFMVTMCSCYHQLLREASGYRVYINP